MLTHTNTLQPSDLAANPSPPFKASRSFHAALLKRVYMHTSHECYTRNRRPAQVGSQSAANRGNMGKHAPNDVLLARAGYTALFRPAEPAHLPSALQWPVATAWDLRCSRDAPPQRWCLLHREARSMAPTIDLRHRGPAGAAVRLHRAAADQAATYQVFTCAVGAVTG